MAAEFSRQSAINREIEETRKREAEKKEQEYLENLQRQIQAQVKLKEELERRRRELVNNGGDESREPSQQEVDRRRQRQRPLSSQGMD